MQGLRIMGPEAQSEILGYEGKEFENKYTRAVLIKNISNRLQASRVDITYSVTISSERSEFDQPEYDEDYQLDIYGDRDYTANIQGIPSPIFMIPEGNEKITVHPYSGYSEILGNIYEDVCVTSNSMSTSVSAESKDFVFNQTIGYLTGKVSTACYFEYAIGDEMLALKENFETNEKLQGINEAMNQASVAQSMMIEGTTVYISGPYNESIYVYEPKYDDKQLVINVAAYNGKHGTNYTIEQMKQEYADNSNVFEKYNKWYTRYGIKETDNLKIELGEEYGKEEYDAMSAEELESALKEKGLF